METETKAETTSEATPEVEAKPSEAKVEAQPQPPFVVAETPEYKGLQRTVNKLQRELELERQRGSDFGKMDDLSSTINTIRAQLALLIEAQSSDGLLDDEKPKLKQKLEAITKEEQRRTAESERIRQEVSEWQKDIKEMLEDSKIDDDSTELKHAQELWAQGKFRESVREVRRVTTKALKAQEVDIKAEVQRLLEEEKRKGMKVDTALPSSGTATFTRSQIEGMSWRSPEYQKNKEEIEKAIKEGRIKEE